MPKNETDDLIAKNFKAESVIDLILLGSLKTVFAYLHPSYEAYRIIREQK